MRFSTSASGDEIDREKLPLRDVRQAITAPTEDDAPLSAKRSLLRAQTGARSGDGLPLHDDSNDNPFAPIGFSQSI